MTNYEMLKKKYGKLLMERNSPHFCFNYKGGCSTCSIADYSKENWNGNDCDGSCEKHFFEWLDMECGFMDDLKEPVQPKKEVNTDNIQLELF